MIFMTLKIHRNLFEVYPVKSVHHQQMSRVSGFLTNLSYLNDMLLSFARHTFSTHIVNELYKIIELFGQNCLHLSNSSHIKTILPSADIQI